MVGQAAVGVGTYGPRSTISISAFSSSRRRLAAQEAPPATPPTMITFIRSLPFFITWFTLAYAHAQDHPQLRLLLYVAHSFAISRKTEPETRPQPCSTKTASRQEHGRSTLDHLRMDPHRERVTESTITKKLLHSRFGCGVDPGPSTGRNFSVEQHAPKWPGSTKAEGARRRSIPVPAARSRSPHPAPRCAAASAGQAACPPIAVRLRRSGI